MIDQQTYTSIYSKFDSKNQDDLLLNRLFIEIELIVLDDIQRRLIITVMQAFWIV
jgi:hypothetical protein